MIQRICPECGSAITGPANRIYCADRCKWRAKDRRREADPIYVERRRARQSTQRRSVYVKAARGTHLCGLCKAPHHSHGLCYSCLRAQGLRAPDRKIDGTCNRCGDAWQKDRKATSPLCPSCFDVVRDSLVFTGLTIDKNNRRRALKLGRIAEVVDVLAIFERSGWICSLCDRAVDRTLSALDPMAPTLEHVIPLSRGGDHVEANCALAHRLCNARKGNRLLAA